MMKFGLGEAEKDGVLQFLASTYRAQDDKIVYGIAEHGPRVIDFAPILKFDLIPLNRMLKALLKICEETLEKMVEVEFAMTLDERRGRPARFGFLQVRPMVVSEAGSIFGRRSSAGKTCWRPREAALGNGLLENIRDIVYRQAGEIQRPSFGGRRLGARASESSASGVGRPYLLIGFGRWGTSDPQAGIPGQFRPDLRGQGDHRVRASRDQRHAQPGLAFLPQHHQFQSLLFLAQSGGSSTGSTGTG